MGRFLAVLFAVTLAAVTLTSVGGATAQTYPSRAVTLVVPEGRHATAVLAQTIAAQMTTALGQTVSVESVPDAGGTVGLARVVHAAPDGYTLLFGTWSSNIRVSAMHPLDYDVLKDLEPIARVAEEPVWLMTRKNFPAKNLKETLAWLKANPGKATAAIVGPGTVAHLCGVYLEKSTGIQLQYVNLGEGSEKAVVDGNADMMCDFAKYSLPLYRDGKVNALAVLAKHRWFAAPNVPTFAEMGVPGVYFSYWDALWAPKGTPKDVIAKLNSAIVASLADPGLQRQLADQFEEIPPRDEQTPEALGAYQKAETEKWGPIIKSAGPKGQ